MRSRSAHKTFPSTASTFYLKGADPQRFPFPTANSAIPGSFRRRSEGFNRAHIAVTCNRRGLPSEFVYVRSIPDRTTDPGVQMRKSSLLVLSSFLLLVSASPSFARATGTETRLGAQKIIVTQQLAPAVPRTGRAFIVRPRPKACNYRWGPKTGTWTCE